MITVVSVLGFTAIGMFLIATFGTPSLGLVAAGVALTAFAGVLSVIKAQ